MSSDKLEFSARWPSPPRGGERDVAELRLDAAGETLTRVSDFNRGEERNYVRASAVSLALWLADNFWRLRYESLPDGYTPSVNWRLRHEMTSASGGTVWPPIMIQSTGERVLLGPAFGKVVEFGSVRYALPGVVTVSGSEFEQGVWRFFDQVVDNCSLSTDGPALEDLVASIKEEAADPAMLSWRRLEARLGFDPDTVPKGLMKGLALLAKQVGEAALDEAAAAAPGRDAGDVLAEVVQAARESEVVVDLSVARQVGSGLIRTGEVPPWELGREAALRVRDLLGISHRPVLMKAFSDLLQVSSSDLKRRGTARGLRYSARMRHRGERHRVALQSVYDRDRRFELSCALADAIWLESDFGVISKAKTDRQKFQRAFAQNFLVPFAGLQSRIDLSNLGQASIDEAAKFYHVNSNVIRRLLILERILPRETFEERLEAA